MAAYIHGNLAVEHKSGQRPKIRETKKLVYRRKSIPVQEKLLYLFTIVLCCVVAGVIIWRYAQIYEINTEIQRIDREVKALEMANNELKLEISKLQNPDRLIREGLKLGLVLPGEDDVTQIELSKKPEGTDTGTVAYQQQKGSD